MQLKTVRMENFGPYRDTTVDFERFSETNLFLITGQTGSGKTTIFDAIVYALYGETSGDARSGEEMRANFAEANARTRVTLTFTHGGKDYVIWREPKQAHLKKDGSFTQAKSAQSLTRALDGQEENEWTKVREIDAQIANLLHLDANQFRQMILLPQGQFRQFLDADSDEKAKLLRQLFGTDLFDRWLTALKQAAKKQDAAVRKQYDRLTVQAQSFEFIQEQEDLEAPLEERLSAMAEDLVLQQAEEKRAAELEVASKKALDDAISATQKSQRIEQAYVDREAAEKALAQLDETEPEIALKKEEVTKLTLVKTLQPDFKAIAQHQSTIEMLQQTRQKTKENLDSAQKQAITVEEKLAKLSEDASSFAEKKRRLMHIADARDSVQQLFQLRSTVQQTRLTFDKAQAAFSQAHEEIERCEALQRINNEQIKKLKDHDKQEEIDTLQARLTEIQPEVAIWKQNHRELGRKQTMSEHRQAEIATAKEEAARADAEYRKLHDSQLSAQIASLAAELSEGAPCPVCGSLEHPAPAVLTKERELVTAEMVAQADKARQTASNRLSTLLADERQNEEDKKTLAKSLQESLEKLSTKDPAELQRGLEESLETLKQAMQTAKEQRAVLEQQRQELDESLQEARAQQDRAQKQYIATQAALNTAQGKLDATEQGPAAEWADIEMLEREEKALITWTTDYEKKSKEAASEHEKITGTLSRLEVQVQEQTKRLSEEKDKLNDERAAFSSALQDKLGLKDNSDFVLLTEELPKLAGLSEEIEQAKQARVEQTALKQQADAVIGENVRPDMVVLHTAQREATDAHNAALEAATRRKDALSRNTQLVESIKVGLGENETAMRAAESAGALASAVGGKNRDNLTLERYVLRRYLADVLEAANVRIASLSSGRYRFRLNPDAGQGVKNSGLDIDVFDDQVGGFRSVHTLSGGESFIAALSLALALGEVIQQEAGGIAIDALFVDEGFGSLDSESLDTAMQALETIEGQARMIGIISHVSELRQTITDQLQVIPDGNGESHVRVTLSTD